MSDELSSPSSAAQRPLHAYPPIAVSSSLFSHYGINSTQYNALSWIDDDVVMLASGKFVLFVHLHTGKIESRVGPDDGAVGVVAVHPTRKHYLVGERRPERPSLIAYEWPSHQQAFSFVNGCIKGYAACSFSADGARVATVGSFPDYTLAVWDWASQAMVLRNKCFGSEVYTVQFSRFDASLLVTGGSGHIKFWSMAHSFTGLKLQGVLGKFGRLENSNITCFEVFPNGKVLSGSESGNLLLWEGDTVHCCFVGKLSKYPDPYVAGQMTYETHPCHTGVISVLKLIHDGSIVMSAGDDSYMRYWDRKELEQAEGEGQPPWYAPACLLEVHVANQCAITSVTYSGIRNEWVVLDAEGAFHMAPFPSMEELRASVLGRWRENASPTMPLVASARLRFNGGALTCCALSPAAHVAVTGGADGVIRLLDYVKAQEVYHRIWHTAEGKAAAVTATYFFRSESAHGTVLCGFEDGTLRLLRLGPEGFAELGVWRPHTHGLFVIAVDQNERQLCTASSSEGTVFFFRIPEAVEMLEPSGFCHLPLPRFLCVEWDEVEGGGCLIGYETGQLLAVSAPRPGEVDCNVSYEFPCKFALVGIRQRRLPPPRPDDNPAEEEKDILAEKDDGPWPVTLVRRLADGGLAIGMRKEELVYHYRGCVRYPGMLSLPPLPLTGVEPPNYVEDPGENLCYSMLVPQAAYAGSCSQAHKLLVVCEHSVILMHDDNSHLSLIGQSHDSTQGFITSANISYDGSVVVTTGTDGLLVAQLLTGYKAPVSNVKAAFSSVEVSMAAREISNLTTQLSLSLVSHTEPYPSLSIQAEKVARDTAKAAAAQERLLDQFYEKIAMLQEEYSAVLDANQRLPEEHRLGPAELELDPLLTTKMEEAKQEKVAAARKEWELNSAREELRTRKMRGRFLDNLLHDRFLVHAFLGDFAVATFRTVNSTPVIEMLQREIAILEDAERENEQEEGRDDWESTAVGEASDEAERSRGGATAADGAKPPYAVTVASTLPGPGWGKDADMEDLDTTLIKESVKQQLLKADKRRMERESRRTAYEQLLTSAPDLKDTEVKLARLQQIDLERRGECVLRTDPAYNGAWLYRPTASAKLQLMIHLRKLIVEKQLTFNKKLIQTRETKRDCLERINPLRKRIAAINEELRDHTVDAAPLCMLDDEEPEKIYEMSRDALEAYAKQKALNKIREDEVKKAQRGFGADLSRAQRYRASDSNLSIEIIPGTRERKASRRHNRSGSRIERSPRNSNMSIVAVNKERLYTELKTKIENIKPSDLETRELALRQEQLTTKRRCLVGQCQAIMQDFDEALYDLFRERVDLDADLCLSNTRLLLLFQEYRLLLTYRERDSTLRNQLNAAKQSRDDLRKETRRVQNSIRTTEGSVSTLQDCSKAMRQEVEAFIHESFPSDKVAYITKVFNRVLKSRRKLDEEDQNDDVTSDEDDNDDGVETDDEIGEELCPPQCDVALWEHVLQMRERRQDMLDEIAEKKTQLEGLRRTIEENESIMKTRIVQVRDCRKQISDLESEKRRDLKLLSTVVPLRCDQVLCLDAQEELPSDLANEAVLVIDDAELQRLQLRIGELQQQKEYRRMEFVGMANEFNQIQDLKATAQKSYEAWEAKVSEVMMLKFGRHVDLEMLESCGTSYRIEALKGKLRRIEMGWGREIRAHEAEIYALRKRLQGEVLRNTHLLQDIGDFEGERQNIEQALSQATTKTVKRFAELRVATVKERADLRDLITAQQNEIDALNSEITMLRRKGGHVYSPSMH